jgi:hypothetical protein
MKGRTILLSESWPRQGHGYYGGHVAGDLATVFYHRPTHSWGYCFHGVSKDGLHYESDDITGFATAEEAEEAARAAYNAPQRCIEDLL